MFQSQRGERYLLARVFSGSTNFRGFGTPHRMKRKVEDKEAPQVEIMEAKVAKSNSSDEKAEDDRVESVGEAVDEGEGKLVNVRALLEQVGDDAEFGVELITDAISEFSCGAPRTLRGRCFELKFLLKKN